MTITLKLFGSFRRFTDAAEVALDLPDVTTVGEFRKAFDHWAGEHWPGYSPALLRASALATETAVLQANSPIPADGRLAVLPPVSGG